MNWRALEIHELVQGSIWRVPPDRDLTVTGASIYAPTYRAGDMVFVRDAGVDFGITPRRLRAANLQPPVAIVGPGSEHPSGARSVLEVPSTQKALFAVAKEARSRLRAPVVGVTGSAGKTSVTAMIAHCLEGAGDVYATRFGANMARGISWNLCCAPRSTDYCVLEMAIGQMTWNSRLARPDVAVFTNIHPSHLIYHKDVRTIAERKSHIFSAMPKSGVAIINADMQESSLVQAAAQAQDLRILSYGQGRTDDIRLIAFNEADDRVTLDVLGRHVVVPLVGKGRSASQNAMAVAGVLAALEQPVESLMERLSGFEIVAGRGALLSIPVEGGQAQILDHSYNANPASMRAALEELALIPCTGRRVAILGQMAELGEESVSQHRALLEDLRSSTVDAIYLVGAAFHDCIGADKQDPRFVFLSLEDLKIGFDGLIRPGDLAMLKGSNSTGLYDFMQRYRQPPA